MIRDDSTWPDRLDKAEFGHNDMDDSLLKTGLQTNIQTI